MALSQSKLEQSLLKLFANPDSISSQQDAEQKWADAYDSYAKDAVDTSNDPVAVTNFAGLRGAFQFNNQQSAPAFAAQLDTGFVAYWTGAVFSIGTPPLPTKCPNVGGTGLFATEITSTVITATPGVVLGSLLPVITSFSDTTTAEQKAKEISTVLHAATTSAILVLITGIDTTPPPSGPLPITNTCTIS